MSTEDRARSAADRNATTGVPDQIPDLLGPARLGPLTLRNRVIKAATFEGVTPGALVSDELIEYHANYASMDEIYESFETFASK
ncbi:hypothetical protein ACFT0D_47790, partial [Streptomyces sp. NPDC056982]